MVFVRAVRPKEISTAEWGAKVEDGPKLLKKIQGAFDCELGNYSTARGWRYSIYHFPKKEFGVALMFKDGVADRWKVVNVLKGATLNHLFIPEI